MQVQCSVVSHVLNMKTFLKYTAVLTLILHPACQIPTDTVSESTQSVIELNNTRWVTLSAGNNNDVALNTSENVLELVPNSSGSTITGFNGTNFNGNQGFWIHNTSTSVPIVLAHQNTSSAASYRLSMPYDQDFSLEPGRYVILQKRVDDQGTYLGWTMFLGPAMYGVTSTSTPSHTIGTSWQVGSRPVLGHYSVRVTSTQTVSGGQTGRVELKIGPSSGSITTVCGRVAGGSTGTLVVGLNLTDVAEGELSCLIPANWWAVISSTDEAGTPSYSITNQYEQSL